MKGIIIAGGTGSRLYPITKVTNKHLLPVFNKPMIYYPLNTLKEAGVKEIAIVSDHGHTDQFKDLFTNNNDYKTIKFVFISQKEAGGIAQALGLCQDFCGHEKIVAILGDNIIFDKIADDLAEFEKQSEGAKIFCAKVADPERHMIVEHKDGKIIGIEEKPFSPKSDLAAVGLYLFNPDVWKIIAGLQPSVRGELEISEVINYYLKQHVLTWAAFSEPWFDIDTYSILLSANLQVARRENIDFTKL